MMDFSVNKSFSLLLILLSFVVIIPTIQANIAEYNDFWKEHELQAIENLHKAYHSNPENVTQEINDHITRTLMEFNSTRRSLKGKKGKGVGPCGAIHTGNKIERGWTIAPLDLAVVQLGGKNGNIYVVTDHTDDPCHPKPETLRHAVIQKAPVWIVFQRSMVIQLKEELLICNNKTIDGRGVNVHIADGAGVGEIGLFPTRINNSSAADKPDK